MISTELPINIDSLSWDEPKLANETDKEHYARYLMSSVWATKRNAAYDRANNAHVVAHRGMCENCKRRPSVAVHHTTYERKFHEKLEDLLVVCERCHEYFHGRLGPMNPALYYYTSPPLDFGWDHLIEHGEWLEMLSKRMIGSDWMGCYEFLFDTDKTREMFECFPYDGKWRYGEVRVGVMPHEVDYASACAVRYADNNGLCCIISSHEQHDMGIEYGFARENGRIGCTYA